MKGLPEYEVFAIKYGDHARTRNDNFLYKDPHDGPMPIDFYVWVIRGNGKTYVVDLGFEAEEAKRRGRNLIRSPSDAVRLVGVDPKTVEDVIVTHMHYDHCGDLSAFPNARLHIQDREMAFATGRYMSHPPLRQAYSVDYVCGMIRALYDERVNFIDGDREIAPGISVHHIGGHTDGLQSVRVWTRRGWVVLASDAIHFYGNLERLNPFPIVFNVAHMLQGYRTLSALADSAQHLIAGHDPAVLRRFPAPGRELEGIAVRLDVPPTHWD